MDYFWENFFLSSHIFPNFSCIFRNAPKSREDMGDKLETLKHLNKSLKRFEHLIPKVISVFKKWAKQEKQIKTKIFGLLNEKRIKFNIKINELIEIKYFKLDSI